MFAGAGVGNVEHIPQSGPVPGIVHQGDALGAAPHIPAHAVVPQVVLGAGGGVRALGVDHQLLMERILVEAGGGGEKARPLLPAAGELPRHLVGHLRVLFCFGWHGILSSFLVLYKSRAARWPPCGSKQCVIHQNPGTAPARQTRRRSWRAAWRGYCRSGPAARSSSALQVAAHLGQGLDRPPGGCRGCRCTAGWFPQRSKSFISDLPFRALFGRCLFMFGFGLAFQLLHNGFFLSRSSRWAAAAKSMREMGWPLRACCSSWATVGSLGPLLMNAVDHAVVILHGHFRIFQRIVRQEAGNLLQSRSCRSSDRIPCRPA